MPSFDFSEYHPLDHNIFDSICGMYFGGWRQHIALWWEYQEEPALRRQTMCRIGRHSWVDYWSGVDLVNIPNAPPTGRCCADCDKEQK